MEDPLAGFQGALFDLDGVIVRLGVDWDAVRREFATIKGVTPGSSVKSALACEERIRAHILEIVGRYEDRATVSPIPSGLLLLRAAARRMPVGLVSNNLKRTVLRALALADAPSGILVLGVDDVELPKPAPGGLLVAARHLGLDPSRTLYVGDAETDREAATAAGMAFLHIDHLK